MSQVPLIYNHNHPLPRLGVSGRAMAGVLSAGCLAVLIIAASLTPDPSGVETHRQLGLPACGLLQMTGVPCMTCGMTTSFSELAHGNVVRSLIVQPGGSVLAIVAAMTFWIAGYIALTGRPGARLLNAVPWTRILFTLLGIVLVAWVYKIIIVLRSHA